MPLTQYSSVGLHAAKIVKQIWKNYLIEFGIAQNAQN